MRATVENLFKVPEFIYFLVRLGSEVPSDLVAFRAFRQDDAQAIDAFAKQGPSAPGGIPCAVYDAPESIASGDGYLKVVVVPQISGALTLVACQLDQQQGVVDSVRFPYTPFSLKVANRLSRKRNEAARQAVLGIEQGRIANQARVFTIVCLLEGQDTPTSNVFFLVKAIVDLPVGCTPKFDLLDDAGGIRTDVVLHEGMAGSITADGFKRTRCSFTMRVPRGAGLMCLAVGTNEQPQCNPAFYRLTEDHLDHLRYAHKHPHYSLMYDEFYRPWLQSKAKVGRNVPDAAACDATFSIVVPLYNTPINLFDQMYASVAQQSYPNWELLLVNASPQNEALRAKLDTLRDDRVKVIELEGNLGIAENTNAGIRAAAGDFVCFLDHDDFLDLDALGEYACYLRQNPHTDALYCDEDLYLEGDGFRTPHFKSGFNQELLHNNNYITHFLAVRSAFAKELLLDSAYDGAQDYDFVLRLSERTTAIGHIAKVLYHWRITPGSTAQDSSNKQYALEAGRRALEDHMHRLGHRGSAQHAPWPCYYRFDHQIEGQPLVSILIPSKDGGEVLDNCIKSIQEKTTYENYEVVIIENNSVLPETFEYYDQVQNSYQNVRVVHYEGGFNYPKINNFGAKQAKGDYLVLLNNDTVVVEPTWIEKMLGLCQQDRVGAVGALLLYPDDTIQHAGVMIVKALSPTNMGGPHHVYQGHDKDFPGHFRRVRLTQEMLAVTAACLMVSAKDYWRVGGMDEQFAVAYNDVDFCLRLHKEGLRNVYQPNAVLYHFESVTRGMDDSSAGTQKFARFLGELGLMANRWGNVMVEYDPYFGPYAIEGM